MGDLAPRMGAGAGTLIGGVARGRCAIPEGGGACRGGMRLSVGDRVRNASGRGAWVFGVVVGVCPPGESLRLWCRRHGLPVLSRAGVCVMQRERCVVLGEDGRHHAPRRVEVV